MRALGGCFFVAVKIVFVLDILYLFRFRVASVAFMSYHSLQYVRKYSVGRNTTTGHNTPRDSINAIIVF